MKRFLSWIVMYALFAAFYYVQSWLWILFQLIFNKIYHFSEALFWVLVILEGFTAIGLIIGGIVVASYGIYRASEAICKSKNGNRYTVVGVIYIIYYIAWSLLMANGVLIANNKFVAIASIATMFVFCISFVVMGRSKYKNSKDSEKNDTIKKSKFFITVIVLIGLSIAGLASINEHYKAQLANLNEHLQTETDNYMEAVSEKNTILNENQSMQDELNFWQTGAVICTPEGKKYHHYGCGHLDGRGIYIFNVEYAKSLGYTPCLDCCKSIDWDNLEKQAELMTEQQRQQQREDFSKVKDNTAFINQMKQDAAQKGEEAEERHANSSRANTKSASEQVQELYKQEQGK